MKNSLTARLEASARQRASGDLERRRRVLDYLPPPAVKANDRRLINFCGNDYLGLSDHPALAEALAEGARDHGTGAGASPLVTGYRRAHRELEARLADFTGFEAALVITSGYQANLALGAGLCDRGDRVAADRLNHASINDGLRLAGARIRRYAHADAQAASRRLQDDARLLATDTVFSMDGDLAPLPELAALCERHDAALWVDDAHGFGVLGDDGRGALEHSRVTPAKVDAYVATFGKALGTGGAFIAGERALIEHLVNTSRPVIYSTALSPALAAATGKVLELVRKESWRRERLRDNVDHFRRRAVELGLQIGDSETPIQPLILGDNTRAVASSRHLENAGLLVAAIRPPTVPAGTARLRITLSAVHERRDIDTLLETLAEWLSSQSGLGTRDSGLAVASRDASEQFPDSAKPGKERVPNINSLSDHPESRPTITFLHGWAMHGGLFRPLFDELEGDFTYARLDLPGHGLNRERAWPDAIADWIAEQVPEGGWLAGWSLGGLLAMQSALRHGGHFGGLILMAATPCFLRRPHWPHGIAPEQLDALGTELASDTAAVINRFLALEVHGDQDAAAQLRLLRREALKHGLPDSGALRTGLDLLRDTDLTGQLGEIDIPVLLLGGRRDRLVSWAALEAVAEKLPQAKLVRIPGAAHAPFLTRAEDVARALAEFVLSHAKTRKREGCKEI